MKIAVDCRYLGKSGIGRVNQGILDHFDVQAHEYWLIGRAADLAAYPFAHIVEDESDPFSAKGLFTFPAHLNKVCDCVIMEGGRTLSDASLRHVITDRNVVIRDGRTMMGHENYPITIAKNATV